MGIPISVSYSFNAQPPLPNPLVSLPIGSDWIAPGGNNPVNSTENGNQVYLFSAGLAQSLTLFVKIPQNFNPTKQLFMYLSYYSPSIVGTVLFQTVASLIHQGVDAVTSTTNQHSSVNTAITNAVVANTYQQVTMDLTDSAGLINGSTLLPGDMIRVDLTRNASDTDTADVRMLPTTTEVAYQS